MGKSGLEPNILWNFFWIIKPQLCVFQGKRLLGKY